jgi:hypothetical protein
MALTTIPGGMWIPRPINNVTAAPAYNGATIDASTEKVGYIFRVPKTGTLDQAEWRTTTVSLNAASAIRTSFQDVSATTFSADGVVDQFRNIAGSSVVVGWNVPGLMTSDGTDSGTKRSVTVGQLLAIVIDYATFTAADSLGISLFDNNTTTVISELSDDVYTTQFVGAWAVVAPQPVFALKYSDGTYEHVPGAYIASALTTTTFNSTSGADELALAFQLPVEVAVGGAWIRMDLDGDADIVLYEGTTARETVSLDKDQRRGAAANSRYVRFSQNRTISAATDWFLAIKPGASNVSAYDFTVNDAAIMNAAEGGANFQFASRVDAGAWTKVATRRLWAGLHVTQIHAAAVAGGGGAVFGGRGGVVLAA